MYWQRLLVLYHRRWHCMSCKAWNIHSQALYRKSMPIPPLEPWKCRTSCNCIASYNVQSTLACIITFSPCLVGGFQNYKGGSQNSASLFRGRMWQNRLPRFWLQIASSFHEASLSLNYRQGRAWTLGRICEYWILNASQNVFPEANSFQMHSCN